MVLRAMRLRYGPVWDAVPDMRVFSTSSTPCPFPIRGIRGGFVVRELQRYTDRLCSPHSSPHSLLCWRR